MMGRDGDSKNLILAAALSMLVVLVWQVFVVPPPPPPPVTAEVAAAPGTAGAPGTTGTVAQPGQGATPAAEAPGAPVTRDAALGASARVPVETPSLRGSISLRGGRIDDLHLERYRETLEPDADTVTLLNPTGAAHPYYAVYGWLRAGGADPGPLPDANTPWELVEGTTLAPGQPVTLGWDNGQGLIFRRTIAIDDRYMFTVTDRVENQGAAAVELSPYGYIARRGEPESIQFFILHEGAVGVFDGTLSELTYDELRELPFQQAEGGTVEATPVASNGWVGFTDKYWMTTLLPASGQPFVAVQKALQAGQTTEYRTEMRLPAAGLAPGQSHETTTRLFAGAKEYAAIRGYQDALGIQRFEDSIDWGWFFFLTKPIFHLLTLIQSVVGNMGWSIILLTLLIKTALFPLAYKSYVSMSRMKMLQPEMEKLKERCGDDRMKMQQEMIALYKREKVNPASGCLPILLQIPIFFSLYKVIFVALELRHAPYFGWIQDLSAPDPTSVFNLFGLLPFDVSFIPPFLQIGVFPVLLGITMWMQQKLNPAPTDPTQAMIFAWMPWMFMFMLGSFASGLVLYWIANNVITITQQYLIMRSQGVEVDLLGNIKSSFKKKRTPAP